MQKLIVFDVNETLLALSALDPEFKRVFGDASIRSTWFAQVLQNSLVATLTGRYDDFGKIAGAALDMTAQSHKIELSEEDRKAILGGVRALPAHADVRAGLDRLKEAGFRLFTLTNSPPHVVEAQLRNAGLSDYFESSLSVDAIRRFKPDAAVYQMTAKELGVLIKEVRLVAAHDWDVAGALLAGCAAAFIARPGKVLNPLMPIPDIVGSDLIEVAEKIIAMDS
ncbi:MAG TPA: haloacid dehalogenase type II [Anaerolineales bacterium]|nr:haloacid dehalogenase type II [Anaerolineales bacterium]